MLISSDSKDELLYLFGCLNSKLIIQVLEKLLRNENEKNYLLAIKSIKQYVRIPKITTENQHTKRNIIHFSEKLLDIEKQTVADLIELDTLMQHVDDVCVEGNNLLLKRGPKELRAAIRRGAAKLVEKALDAHFGPHTLIRSKRTISLAEIKKLPVIDKEKQDKIKVDIDELVFDLYGLTKAERVLMLSE